MTDIKGTMPLFTVIIPAYNRENTIKRTVLSVLDQTYNNIETIIVDDGSRDHTKDVILECLDQGDIRYVYQENGGAQKARNTGLASAKGDYILFLDSDDWLLPECIEKLVHKFEEDRDVGAVYFLTGIKEDGTVSLARNDTLSGNVYKEVLEQGYLTSTSFISMRRNIFKVIGNWDVQFPASQDDDMCFRITKKYKVALIPEILGIYGIDAGVGKQIGSSPKRVADGWWLLWQKYEADVTEICGEEVFCRHVEECMYRYAWINDIKAMKECNEKLEQYSYGLNTVRVKAGFYRFAGIVKRQLKALLKR